MISNAMNSGVMGIQTGMNQLANSAQEIASQAAIRPDPAPAAAPAGGEQAETTRPVAQARSLAEPLIEQQQALYQVQAGAKVVETTQETVGRLLNALA
ncbi:MAG: hypothetical protein EA420_09915 [Candidatus Competibacteraceae bacterium]|nr:MAG: hypothetical protein EA420_09915 [Candidatus Competibacteraceae bacterium]